MLSALLSPLVLAGSLVGAEPLASIPVYQTIWGGPGSNSVIILDPSGHDGYNSSVLVEFNAQGKDWGRVWLNGKEAFRFLNLDRRETITLAPGAYRVVITGASKFDVWAAGYLNVGQTHVLRVNFAKGQGVFVQGDPYAWLPDATLDPTQIWRH